MNEQAATLRAQWLGQRLRAMRESARLTLRDLGDFLNRNTSAVSRMRVRNSRTRVPEVSPSWTYAGSTNRGDATTSRRWRGTSGRRARGPIRRQRRRVPDRLDLARESGPRDPVLPGVCHSRAAPDPGLRRGSDRGLGRGLTDDEVPRFVELRMKRQRRRRGPDRPALVVIDEGALRRVVGDPRQCAPNSPISRGGRLVERRGHDPAGQRRSPRMSGRGPRRLDAPALRTCRLHLHRRRNSRGRRGEGRFAAPALRSTRRTALRNGAVQRFLFDLEARLE